MDVALNNLQWLICHKTQRNKQTNKQINLVTRVKMSSDYSIRSSDERHYNSR